MRVIGERLRVLSSSDPTKVGMTGSVLLESANTLVIDSAGRDVRVEKSGSDFLLLDSGRAVRGSDIVGRLEDRWGKRV